MLPCVAVCCCVLQKEEGIGSNSCVLQRVTVYCSELQYVDVCCSVSQRVAKCYSVLQCASMSFSVLQRTGVRWLRLVGSFEL